jgi:hypothetical protein
LCELNSDCGITRWDHNFVLFGIIFHGEFPRGFRGVVPKPRLVAQRSAGKLLIDFRHPKLARGADRATMSVLYCLLNLYLQRVE